MPASSGLAPRDETFQRAALELHERRGEVLHGPRPAPLLGHPAQPVDVPRQHVHQVEEVGEVVQQRPLVLGPPPRRRLAAVHVAVDVVQVAYRALVQQLLHPDPVAFPAAVVVDLQQDAGALAGIDHGVALLQRQRHGFSQMIAFVVDAAEHPTTISRCNSGCVATMHTSGPTSSSI